jgi:hypothetical protein
MRYFSYIKGSWVVTSGLSFDVLSARPMCKILNGLRKISINVDSRFDKHNRFLLFAFKYSPSKIVLFITVTGLYSSIAFSLDKYISGHKEDPIDFFFSDERFYIANTGFSIFGFRLGSAVQ